MSNNSVCCLSANPLSPSDHMSSAVCVCVLFSPCALIKKELDEAEVVQQSTDLTMLQVRVRASGCVCRCVCVSTSYNFSQISEERGVCVCVWRCVGMGE